MEVNFGGETPSTQKRGVSPPNLPFPQHCLGALSSGFAEAQPRLAKIAQYIAIFRLTADTPYLRTPGEKAGVLGSRIRPLSSSIANERKS